MLTYQLWLHRPAGVGCVCDVRFIMIKNISSFIRLKPVLAVGFLFSASSLVFGTWVAAIPGIKYRLGFNDATLGLSLLLSPLGALTGVLLSTKLFSKIPVGKWMTWGYVALCIIMILQINSVNRIMMQFVITLQCGGAFLLLLTRSSDRCSRASRASLKYKMPQEFVRLVFFHLHQ